MLISAIISEVISEVGADATDSVLIGKMLTFAKGALRRFPLFARARLFNVTSYATLVAGADYLTTPTYFLDDNLVWFEDSGSRRRITKITDERTWADLVDSTAAGDPQYYHINGNVIEFDRKAAADRVIYVAHVGEVDDVIASSDFFGTTTMVEILKDGIKATYYSDYVEDAAKGDRKFGIFQAELDKLEEEYMKQTMGGHVGDGA